MAVSADGSCTSLNNAGEVAFTAQLDNDEQGLFSGTGGPVTTHYTSATPVRIDGVTTDLAGGNFGRPFATSIFLSFLRGARFSLSAPSPDTTAVPLDYLQLSALL